MDLATGGDWSSAWLSRRSWVHLDSPLNSPYRAESSREFAGYERLGSTCGPGDTGRLGARRTGPATTCPPWRCGAEAGAGGGWCDVILMARCLAGERFVR